MSEQQRFPLSWPAGWQRTPAASRRFARFNKRRAPEPGAYPMKERLTVGDGLARLLDELRRLGARDVVVSSNLRLRLDGLPYADAPKRVDDPGVAVYFRLGGQPRVLACDKWTSAADNLAAIAGHIEAIRAVDRYGVGSLERAFAGYAALPDNTAKDWRAAFGFEVHQPVTWNDVENAFRLAARDAHPDRGGSHDQMARLSEAKEYARRELTVR